MSNRCNVTACQLDLIWTLVVANLPHKCFRINTGMESFPESVNDARTSAHATCKRASYLGGPIS